MATFCKKYLTPKDFNLIIKTSEVVQYDGPAFSCVSLPGSPTLNNVLSALESKVCNIQNTQLQNIATSQIVDYDGTHTFSCFSLTPNATLETILDELGTQICVNTTALAALDCTDIEVTAVYTAVNYTPASAHLCGHLEGIDDELATFLTSVPSCLGNNLFTDGNNGFFETGITGMASTDFTLAQSVVQAYQGTKSLKATMGASSTNDRIHGTTTISFTAGETYILSGYVYAPSANSTGGATKMLAWDGASEFTELTPVDTVDTSSVQDVWVLIQTTLQPSTNKSLTIGIKAEGLSNTDKIFIDQLEVRCGSQNLVTEEELIDRFKRLVCSWTIEGGNITTGAGSLDVDIDASLYEVSGAFVTVPDTATTTSITLAATSDNYIDVDQNGNYLVTSVAISASEPAVAANRMRLFKVVTDGVGVPGAAVDRQNIYPFCNGAAFGDQIIGTRHLVDLNVTGAKMENVVTGASVDIANITFDNKGRVTAATSDFTITAPAANEILQYNGAKWVNVAILGTILPAANNNETLRYDTGAVAWQGSGYLINTGSAIGINLTTPQVALNLAKNLEFAINMAEPTGVGSALAAGGGLTPGTAYYYVVTALDDGSGETVVSAETTKTADAVNKTINVSWSAVTGASTYRVYKGVATGVYTEYFTITVPTVTYSDNGAAGAAGSPPSVTTAYVVSLGSSHFLDQIGFGTTTPDASALIDIESITQGFGLPAMTTTQRNAIGSPKTGLVVFNTTTSDVEFYNSAAWIGTSIGNNGIYTGSGSLGGATVVTMGTNDLQFDSTGITGLFTIDTTNNRVGIGIDVPVANIHIKGNTGSTLAVLVENNAGTDFLQINEALGSFAFHGTADTAVSGVKYYFTNTNFRHLMEVNMVSTNASAGDALLVKNEGTAAATNTGIRILTTGATGGAAANVALHLSSGNFFFPLANTNTVNIGHSSVQTGALVNIRTKAANGAFKIVDSGVLDSFIVTDDRNVGIITTTFGTNAVGVLGIETGVAPTTSIADMFQVYSANHSGAGTATFHMKNEEADVIKLFKGAALTPVTPITHTAPGTPDYAIQDLVQPAGFGFVTKDEGNTVLSVIASLLVKVDELEDRLVAFGLL